MRHVAINDIYGIDGLKFYIMKAKYSHILALFVGLCVFFLIWILVESFMIYLGATIWFLRLLGIAFGFLFARLGYELVLNKLLDRSEKERVLYEEELTIPKDSDEKN